MIHEAVNSPLQLPEDALAAPPSDPTHSNSTLVSTATIGGKGSGGKKGGGHYEQWEVARAIEKKDVMALMEIKQSQFDLLISGNPLPIVYAMRLGKSRESFKRNLGRECGQVDGLLPPFSFWRFTDQDIAILLIGAMSRKVNDVTDDELAMMNSSTKATLYEISFFVPPSTPLPFPSCLPSSLFVFECLSSCVLTLIRPTDAPYEPLSKSQSTPPSLPPTYPSSRPSSK